MKNACAALLLLVPLVLSAQPLHFIPPLDTYRISSPFGDRNDVMGGGDLTVHAGIDMVSVKNAKVKAAADGEVIIHYPPPGKGFKGHPVYGGFVVIRHWDKVRQTYIYTRYAHMKETWVFEGMKVKQGERIGVVGSTGVSTGPHLHFEILYDPKDFFTGQFFDEKRIWLKNK